MNKNINIALVTLLTFGALSAQAQTIMTTSVDASVAGTVNTTAPAPIMVPPVRPTLTNDQVKMMQRGIPVGAGVGSTTKPVLPPKPGQAGMGIRPIIDATRASSTELRKEMRADIKDARQDMEMRAQALRASTTAARAEMKDLAQKNRLEIAHNKADFVNKRIDAAIERVQKLSDRVSVALDQAAAQGATVTTSRTHLAEAKVKLDEARVKSAAVKLAIETAFASSTPKVALQSVQALVKDATKSIQEAHRHVAEAISSIKPGFNKPHASTTLKVNASVGSTTTTQ